MERTGPVWGGFVAAMLDGTLAFLAGELRTGAGELVATATATARIVKQGDGATK
ncbi:MAG TPA: hypothetical protein VJT10_18430 [Steroidobacteraceae bacterium]|nr:hypothetical protein [Steroidobacteraceae bacterium]